MTKLSNANIDGFRVVLLTSTGESDVSMWRDMPPGGYSMDMFKAARIVGDAMDFLQRQIELEMAKTDKNWEPVDG